MLSKASTQPTNNVDSKVKITTLSQDLAKARAYLAKHLYENVDGLLTEPLKSEENKLPYDVKQAQAPQVEALMKLFNCMYYAEQLLTHWEIIQNDTYEQLLAVPEVYKKVIQFYDSLADLDNVAPELYALYKVNYHAIASVLELIEKQLETTSWLSEFNAKSRDKKSQILVDQSIELLKPIDGPEAKENTLEAALAKMADMLDIVAGAQGPELSQQELDQCIKKFGQLLLDLDKNTFFKKYTYEYSNQSKILQELMQWLLSVQQENLKFTPRTLKKYLHWVNTYLPQMLIFLDKLEQQNFTISGRLTDKVSKKFDKLSQELNNQLSTSSLKTKERIVTSDLLASKREARITGRQIQIIEKIYAIKAQKEAAQEFYKILNKYKNYSLCNINEADRLQIIAIYNKIQLGLALCNLEIENSISNVLKQEGPKELVDPNLNRMKAMFDTINVNDVFKIENTLYQYFDRQIASEEIKFKLAEKARRKIEKIEVSKDLFLNEVDQRKNVLQCQILNINSKIVGTRKHLQPVKVSELPNLRGMLIALQSKKISQQVSKSRAYILQLVTKHLTSEELKEISSKPPYLPNKDNSEEMQQIKGLLNNLHRLEQVFVKFESQEADSNKYAHLKFMFQIKGLLIEIAKNYKLLNPAYMKYLKPIIDQIEVLYKKTAEEDDAAPKALNTNEDSTVTAGYQKNINTLKVTRDKLLKRCNDTLSQPLQITLKPNRKGTPFTDFEKDAPLIQTIKKLINSLYNAEMLYRILQQNIQHPQGTLDQLINAHQLIAALAQVHQILQDINSATHLQNFAAYNHDIFDHLYKKTLKSIEASAWYGTIKEMDIPKTVGGIIGQEINALQPAKNNNALSSPLIQLLTKLPLVFNQLSASIDEHSKENSRALRINKKKIHALATVFEYLFTDNGSASTASFQYLQTMYAITEIISKSKQQSKVLLKTSIEAYQKWIKHYYPLVLFALDDLETNNNLRPELLSETIIQEIDAVNKKCNEIIQDNFPNIIEAIPVSADLAVPRAERLQQYRLRIEDEKTKNQTQGQIADLDLKIRVIDTAIESLKLSTPLPEASLKADIVITAKATAPSQNNLSYLLQLNPAQRINSLRKDFSSTTKKLFTEQFLMFMQKASDNSIHKIDANEPNIVRQTKKVENSFIELEQAFRVLEQMHAGKSMFALAEATIKIHKQLNNVYETLKSLPKDLKAHYGPVIKDLKKIRKQIKATTYNKGDVKEFGILFKETKKEVLKTHKQQASTEDTLFRIATDQVNPEVLKQYNITVDNRPNDARDINKRAAKLASKYLHLASPKLEQARLSLIKEFPAIYGENISGLAFLNRQQLANDSYMDGEIKRLTTQFNNGYGYNYTTCKAFWHLFKQSLRVGSQVDELGTMGNQLISKAPIDIKVKIYSEQIFHLSQREDQLCLKPGILTKPVMESLNQLCMSIALELDMPFAAKLDLLCETKSLTALIDLIEKNLEQLNNALKKKPADADLQLQIKIKKIKLSQLKNDLAVSEAVVASAETILKNKNIIIDHLFEAQVRRDLEELGLELDIAKQYRDDLLVQFNKEKLRILELDTNHIDSEIDKFLSAYKNKTHKDYILVDKASQMFQKLHNVLPDKYATQKQYLDKTIKLLKNANEQPELNTVDIAQRANVVRLLPHDKTFLGHINSIEGGPSFLTQLKQLIVRVVSSATKAINTNQNFFTVYKRKELKQTLQNIEEIEKHYNQIIA